MPAPVMVDDRLRDHSALDLDALALSPQHLLHHDSSALTCPTDINETTPSADTSTITVPPVAQAQIPNHITPPHVPPITRNLPDRSQTSPATVNNNPGRFHPTPHFTPPKANPLPDSSVRANHITLVFWNQIICTPVDLSTHSPLCSPSATVNPTRSSAKCLDYQVPGPLVYSAIPMHQLSRHRSTKTKSSKQNPVPYLGSK